MMILVRNLNGLLELLLLLIMSISFNDLIGKRGRKKKEDTKSEVSIVSP